MAIEGVVVPCRPFTTARLGTLGDSRPMSRSGERASARIVVLGPWNRGTSLTRPNVCWRRIAAKAGIGTAALSAMLMAIEPNEAVAQTKPLPSRTIEEPPLAGAIADDPATGRSLARPGASAAALPSKDNGARKLGSDRPGVRLVADDSGGSSAADSNQPSKDDGYNEICRTVERASAENDLPVEFFTRLIWQESGFKTRLTSRKGARGIAQFMPATASQRGLRNPFEPLGALKESASYLRELVITFGNLGLAAAAYNAGPGRINRWLAGKARLPSETTSYVQIVTGHPVTEWASASPPKWDSAEIPKGVPCDQLKTMITARSEPAPATTDQTTGAAQATPEQTNEAPDETTAQTRTAALEDAPAQPIVAAPVEAPTQTGAAAPDEPTDQTRVALGEVTEKPPAAPKETPGRIVAALLATLDGASEAPDANSPASGQKTWGVQLAGNWEEGKVLASFERIRRKYPEIIGEHRPLVLKQRTALGQANRYVLRISEPTRESAESLCDQLRAADGACLVLANP